jgi:hypothetical protein
MIGLSFEIDRCEESTTWSPEMSYDEEWFCAEMKKRDLRRLEARFNALTLAQPREGHDISCEFGTGGGAF